MNTFPNIKTVSILGCGWFGLALAKKLIQLNYLVKGSTTTPEKIETLKQELITPYLINFTGEQVSADAAFFDSDVLFICIPPKRNSIELTDYPKKIEAIIKTAENKTKHIILISSTSVYADENKRVDEETETNPATASGHMVLAAETLFKNLKNENHTIIRFAGLIGPNRNPGRFFAGKTAVPNGLAPVNLIHQQDAVGIAIAILAQQAFGRTYNACAPNHPSKQDFYTKAAHESALVEPKFISEKNEWKIVESINVPKYLEYYFEVDI